MTKLSQNVRTDKNQMRTETASIEIITPALAQEWLEKNLPLNRRKTLANVEFLADQMKEGEWKLNGESIKFDINGDLFDGQHRLTAVVQSGAVIKSWVMRNMPVDSVDTVDSGKPRSYGDRISMKGVKNSRNIATIINYVRRINNNLRQIRKMTPAEMFSFYDKNPTLQDSFLYINKLYKNSKYADLPANLGTALYYLFSEKDEKAASSFMYRLYTGLNITDTKDPVYVLRQKLKPVTNRPLPPRYRVIYIIMAWNAQRLNKKISMLRVKTGSKFPKII